MVKSHRFASGIMIIYIIFPETDIHILSFGSHIATAVIGGRRNLMFKPVELILVHRFATRISMLFVSVSETLPFPVLQPGCLSMSHLFWTISLSLLWKTLLLPLELEYNTHFGGTRLYESTRDCKILSVLK